MTLTRTVVFAFAAACSSVALAGDLTPPGAPAPTMKTLDQVEPRIPIGQADVPLTIVQPGSYYLTENLFPANLGDAFVIEIVTDDVTLDLRGFRIQGATEVTTANYGVRVSSSVQNIVVRDGTITGCQFSGVEAILAEGISLESLRLNQNGSDGARVGSRSRIVNCSAFGNTSDGFTITGAGGVIINTVAEANGVDGIDTGASTSLENCTANTNGRFGYTVAAGSTAVNCTAFENGQDGFFVIPGSVLTGCSSYLNSQSGYRSNGKATLVDCTAISNKLHGFELGDRDRVIACSASDNDFSGFDAAQGVEDCRIDGNSATGNTTGFNIAGASNVVISNNAGLNSAFNFLIVGGNVTGPTVTSANIAANTNPSANYAH